MPPVLIKARTYKDTPLGLAATAWLQQNGLAVSALRPLLGWPGQPNLNELMTDVQRIALRLTRKLILCTSVLTCYQCRAYL